MAKKKKSTRKRSRRHLNGGYQVFLSHATADKWVARALTEKIELQGATYFRDDRDIDGGDDIPESIRAAIRKSREFVVLLTPKSVDREWVRLEMGAAWGWKKRIIIILHHLDAHPMPETFKPLKALQLNDIEQYFTELKARVNGERS